MAPCVHDLVSSDRKVTLQALYLSMARLCRHDHVWWLFEDTREAEPPGSRLIRA